MQKNDIVTVEIKDIGISGEGIGKIDGYTLFIKDTVVGDVVKAKIMKAKKNYGYAKLMNIIRSSDMRISPVCSAARQCGGCQIQEMNYDGQLAFKYDKVRNNLMRLGDINVELLDQVMEPICGMDQPFRYRNKAQFPIGRDRNGQLTVGFYAGRTHSIIPVPDGDCVLGVEENKKVLQKILDYMEKYGVEPYDEESHTGLVRHVLIRKGFMTNEIMVCFVINGKRLPHKSELIQQLIAIEGMTSISSSVNEEKTNVIMGNEIKTIWGKDYITDYIGTVKYQISPLSFYQVNPIQTEKLYGIALDYAGLTGKETVWDLYCGIGTISLFLAQKAKQVYGVEIVPQAIDDAKNNATINNIHNVSFYVGKAEEVLPRKYKEEGIYGDVIVVDPPRKGCEETVLDTMVKMQPRRIVYVSCDSATLARDVKYLRKRGYELEKVRAVDMFPQTVHVETVALLSRKSASKSFIPVSISPKDMGLPKDKPQPTYANIRDYVQKTHGMKVSSLYVAQIKDELGLDKQFSYEEAEMSAERRPKCPPEKREAILDAFRHFGLIGEDETEK